MNLAAYIKTIGEQAASRLFSVSIHTVRSWRAGSRLPRPAKAREIVEATGGRVTLESIYGE